jgi:hypothetical protein
MVRFRVARPCQYDYARLTGCFEQVLYEVKTALVAQVEVQQNDIGLRAGCDGNRFAAVTRFAYHGHAVAALYEEAQGRADHHMVINQHDSYRLCAG